MKYAIIASEEDPAGMNIIEALKELSLPENVSIHTVKEHPIYQEGIDERIEADYIIFASTHRSEAGRKSLTVHVPGNYSKADFGGSPNQLCIAPAEFMKAMFINLNKNAKGFDSEITLEVTHHGPLLKRTPCIFAEIGCKEEHWKDEEAGKIMAKTIAETLAKPIPKAKTIIAFGGNHYCAGFNKYELSSEYAFGHVCPRYAIDDLDEKVVSQMIKRSEKRPEFALIDWKGLKSNHRNKVLNLLEKIGMPWKKSLV